MAVTSTVPASITATDDVTGEQIAFPISQRKLDGAPVLSAPTVVETTSDSGTVSVATDLPSEGVLFARIYDAAATPSDPDVLAGTGALHTQSGMPDASGTTSFAFTLATGQSRKAHFVQQCSAILSNTVATASFVASSDSTAPVLSAASATAASDTSVDWSVTTDEAGGTLAVEIRLASDSSVIDTASVSVLVAGTETGSFTGLSEGTAYVVAFTHTDAAGNASTEATASVTTTATAPVLSSPSATPTGETTADFSVTTDEGNGPLYRGAWADGATPSAADVKSGTGAIVHGSQAVSATGAQTGSLSGLTAGTAYEFFAVHEDAAGTLSAVATVGFTTDAAAAENLAVAGVRDFEDATWENGTGFDFTPAGAVDIDLASNTILNSFSTNGTPYNVRVPDPNAQYRLLVDVDSVGATGQIGFEIQARRDNGFGPQTMKAYTYPAVDGTATQTIEISGTTAVSSDRVQARIYLRTSASGSGTARLSNLRFEQVS